MNEGSRLKHIAMQGPDVLERGARMVSKSDYPCTAGEPSLWRLIQRFHSIAMQASERQSMCMELPIAIAVTK